MTREETVKLLAMLRASYPNTKITDAQSTLSAWEMVLGEYSAEKVYKAARLHLEVNKFFPTPADIIEHMTRAEVLYQTPNRLALSPRSDAEEKKIDEYLDGLCRQMVELEVKCESDLGKALPYEI